MSDHHHDEEHSELSEMQLRVRSLEAVLTEKGYLDPSVLDQIVERYETQIGPHIGAHIVARAWVDPVFKAALLDDAKSAVRGLGHEYGEIGDLTAVENTELVHNVVVCTLCSCYPYDILGLPPVWYKSAEYRSRTVRDPRGVLEDFGLVLDPDTQIRVWDSTAENRYLVVPARPAATEGWDEEALAELVTRNSMIGTGVAEQPSTVA